MKTILTLFIAFSIYTVHAQIPNLTFTQNFNYPENDPQDGSAGSILDPNNMSLYQGNYNIPYIAITSLNAVPIASGEAVMFRIFVPPYVSKVSISINGNDGLATQFLRVAVIGEDLVSAATPTSYTSGDLLDNQWQWLSSAGNYVYNRNSTYTNSGSEIYLVMYNGQNVDANYDGIPEGDYPQTLTLGSFTMSWSVPDVNQQDYIDWANGVQNAAPTCSIVTPTNNQIFTQGDNVPFSVNATDDSAIDSVQLYIDGNLLTTMTTAPYDYTLPTDLSTPIGIYSVYAIAYDDNGLTTQSSTIQIELVANTAAVTELSNVELTVYPNPVVDFVSIKTAEKINSVSIINSRGELVLTSELSEMIDVSKLNKGVYFMQIETEKGMVISKMIKK